MGLKEMIKPRLFDFLLIQAGIALAMGIIGCLKPPQDGLPYYIFFMPFVYAFFCTLPGCVTYSSRELSIREMSVRMGIEFILDEAAALGVAYFTGALDSGFMVIAIIIAVAVIFLFVAWIDYMKSKSDTDEMTRKIKELQNRERERKKMDCQ